jgi:hypothetical protein
VPRHYVSRLNELSAANAICSLQKQLGPSKTILLAQRVQRALRWRKLMQQKRIDLAVLDISGEVRDETRAAGTLQMEVDPSDEVLLGSNHREAPGGAERKEGCQQTAKESELPNERTSSLRVGPSEGASADASPD